MNFIYRESSMAELHSLIKEYAGTLSSPFDSFLEDHIAASNFYIINCDNTDIGYFASNKDYYITQFYIKSTYLKYAQGIFKEILEQFQIKHALVCTGDELFLSLVLDQETVVKKQAYFFQDSKRSIDDKKLYHNGIFSVAEIKDVPNILKVSGDFFDALDKRVERGEIFVLKEGEELLGAGIIEYGRVLEGYASIGMFANEKHRQKGIGTTIITRLMQWCYEHGYTPICGCWYYNHNSKRTLEAAGMVTKTRLLNVEFAAENKMA